MKIKPIFFAAAFMLLLSACSGGTGATPTPSPSPTPTPAPVITVQSDSKEYKAEDSTLILTVDCSLPFIENAAGIAAYEAINGYYASQMSSHMNSSDPDLPSIARDDYDFARKENYEFFPYAFEMSFTQTLLSETKASFYRMVYSYTGGVHGNLAVIGDTFDLSDGKRLPLGDLFSVPEEEYTKLLQEEMIALAGSDPDLAGLFEGYEESITEYFNPANFYLTETDLVIFYQPYDIAPWAAGVPTFKLPLEGLKDILK